jgi:hypothetical protein
MFQADGEEGCKMTTASLSASNVFICDKVPPSLNGGSFLIQTNVLKIYKRV